MDAQDFRSLQEAYMEVVENQQLDEEAPKRIGLYPSSPKLMKDAGPARVHDPKKLKTKKVKRVEVEEWVNALVEEGYDLSGYTWDEMYEFYLNEGYKELPVDKMIAKSKSLSRIPREPGAPRWDRNAQRASDIRRIAGTHSRAKVKKVEQKNRERGIQREQVDIYDIILSHLLDEGYAETPEAAEAIMVNMSEEWRESIVEDTINERVKYSDNDYRGGGGDRQRDLTGMTTRQVSQLGRKNINRAIENEPLGTQIKQKLFGREVPVPPNAGFKPGGWRMLPGTAP